MNDDSATVSGLHGPRGQTRSPELNSESSAEPDVLLEVPQLRVDEVVLDVGDLRARVSLQAMVPNLLRLSVGADVELSDVRLEIKGVDAQALLKVRLDKVAETISSVMTVIDRNPEILEMASDTLGSGALNEREGLGPETLLEQVRSAARSVDELGGEVLPTQGDGAPIAAEAKHEEEQDDDGFSTRQTELEEMDRAALKAELKQADPTFKVFKKHSDDELRDAILAAEFPAQRRRD